MKRAAIVALAVAAAAACHSAPEPVQLTDLSRSLDALRVAFDAHRGEPRFLTLLSPT